RARALADAAPPAQLDPNQPGAAELRRYRPGQHRARATAGRTRPEARGAGRKGWNPAAARPRPAGRERGARWAEDRWRASADRCTRASPDIQPASGLAKRRADVRVRHRQRRHSRLHSQRRKAARCVAGQHAGDEPGRRGRFAVRLRHAARGAERPQPRHGRCRHGAPCWTGTLEQPNRRRRAGHFYRRRLHEPWAEQHLHLPPAEVVAVGAMKWWGWGLEDDAFTHEDKPALAPYIANAIGLDVRPPRVPPPRFEDLRVPEPSLPAVMRDALCDAVGEANVSLDPRD